MLFVKKKNLQVQIWKLKASNTLLNAVALEHGKKVEEFERCVTSMEHLRELEFREFLLKSVKLAQEEAGSDAVFGGSQLAKLGHHLVSLIKGAMNEFL